MLNYRMKKLSAALACTTCLCLPLQVLAKDDPKNKTAPPHPASAPVVHTAPAPNNVGHGAPNGGTGNTVHPSNSTNQFSQHGPGNPTPNTVRSPGSNSVGGGNHNLSTGQNAHGPVNPTVHSNSIGANNVHTAGPSNALTPHNAATSNALVHPAGPLVHPAGPLVHPAGSPGVSVAAHGAGAGTPLSHAQSQTQLGQLNASRAGMHGINGHPLPAGEVSAHPGGGYSVHTAHGSDLGVRPNGTLASFSGHGEAAHFGTNGHLNAYHSQNMDIHNIHGERFVSSVRPDHSRLVSYGPHRGYLERPYAFGGHAYMQRSYAWGGHVYNRYFYPYRWHGLLLAGAIATAYYAPHFYGWAYDPWAAPVAYNWGWRSAPWYGYYNGYFTPSPSYSDGAAWLTDYSLSQNLAAAYDDGQSNADAPLDDAPPPAQLGAVYSDAPAQNFIAAPAATPITPELKAAIAAEVHRQLAEEQAAAANPNGVAQTPQLQTAMQAGNVFIVSSSLATTTSDQRQCVLTPGDTLQLQNPPGDNDPTAVLRVASTKKGDCPANTNVQLSFQNLADMQNDLRMQIDSGLAQLQENQGKDGLPPAPGDALAKPKAALASNDASGAADVQALLDAQRKQADQAEAQISQDALSGS
jgi:hypothetical protein